MGTYPLFYAGNIAYYRALLSEKDGFILEHHEHFPKQTFRNRMEVLGPNGRQKLIIPTVKTGDRRSMNDVEISYAENWQKIHWKSLEAAYRRSPYFEYYEHRFKELYHTETKLLWDFNMKWFKLIDDFLDLKLSYRLTEGYEAEIINDFRSDRFGLSGQDSSETYLQVFNDRHPFEANLSILDAVFNLGPQARDQIIK